MFIVSIGLLILNGFACSFAQNLDFAKYIPEDDLNAVQSGSFKSAIAQSDLPGYYQADIAGCSVSERPPCPLQISAPAYFKLPNGTVLIPYIVEPEVDESLLDPIVSALDAMAGQVGCVQFISADDAPSRKVPVTPVIRFVHGDNCAGEFGGAKSPAHKVYVDGKCVSGEKGNIQRLVLLALGLPHEHVRNDRDQYIIINYYNVIPERTWEFEKYEKGIFDTLPYDYDSLLHPGYVFLAQRIKTPTIMAKTKARLGQNAQLSAGDVAKVRRAICQVSTDQPDAPQTAKGPADQGTASPAAIPTPTPTKKPATNVDDSDVVPIPIPPVVKKPTETGSDDVQPSMSLPVTRCSLRQLVFVENTQTLSRTLVYPTKRRKQHSTRESTWWYAQDLARVSLLATTKDYLGQSADYPEFAGVVKTVTVKMAEPATRILETEYQPSVMEDGVTRLQTKFETRIVRCQDRERSLQ